MSNPDEPKDTGLTIHSGDGVAFIAAERRRQLEDLGMTAENDDLYVGEQLPCAAAAMALPPSVLQRKELYPFNRPSSFDIAGTKMLIEDRIHELARSGALAAAEIDRLLRLNTKAIEREEKKSRIIKPPGFGGKIIT